jgi:hypothetical protein
VFTDDEFKAQLSSERENYLAVLKRLLVDPQNNNRKKSFRLADLLYFHVD